MSSAVPEDVVEIVPQYEGYDYVVVGEQVLIIDPNTMEIVAVIETYADTTTRCGPRQVSARAVSASRDASSRRY